MGTTKRAGVYEIRNRVESEPWMDFNAISHTMDLMAQKLDQILALKVQEPVVQPKVSPYPQMVQSPQEACNLCASLTHNESDCPTAAQLPTFIQEQVQAAQSFAKLNFDPYSNTYNPRWKQYPNFSWNGQLSQAPLTNSTSQFAPKPPLHNQVFPTQFKPQGNFSTQQPFYQHPPQFDPNEEKFNQI